MKAKHVAKPTAHDLDKDAQGKPKSTLDIARLTIDELGKQSGLAHQHANSFRNMDMAPDLVAFLEGHCKQANTLLGELQKLVKDNIEEDGAYAKTLANAATLVEAWEKQDSKA